MKKPQHMCRGLNIFIKSIAIRHIKKLTATTNYFYLY